MSISFLLEQGQIRVLKGYLWREKVILKLYLDDFVLVL